jgi:hypothetical protein
MQAWILKLVTSQINFEEAMKYQFAEVDAMPDGPKKDQARLLKQKQLFDYDKIMHPDLEFRPTQEQLDFSTTFMDPVQNSDYDIMDINNVDLADMYDQMNLDVSSLVASEGISAEEASKRVYRDIFGNYPVDTADYVAEVLGRKYSRKTIDAARFSMEDARRLEEVNQIVNQMAADDKLLEPIQLQERRKIHDAVAQGLEIADAQSEKEQYFGQYLSENNDLTPLLLEAKIGIPRVRTFGKNLSINNSLGHLYLLSQGYSVDELFDDSPEMEQKKQAAGQELVKILSAQILTEEQMTGMTDEERKEAQEQARTTALQDIFFKGSQVIYDTEIPEYDINDPLSYASSIPKLSFMRDIMTDAGQMFEYNKSITSPNPQREGMTPELAQKYVKRGSAYILKYLPYIYHSITQ